jgi:hypothetical protein
VQLAPKHLLPMRQTRREASSSSTSTSSPSSSSEGAAPARGASPERGRLQQALWPALERSRKLVRHYSGNGDHFQELEADAREANAPCRAFAVETVTRWNSTLELLTRELLNDRALAISAAKRGERPGVERLSAGAKTAQLHLCVALAPLRLATKMLEGDGEQGRASLYLPMFARLRAALTAGGTLAVPTELREQFPAPIPAGSLGPLARDCRKWLAKDLWRVRAKHLEGTDGHRLLLAVTFLDPRFKDCPRQAGQPGPVWASQDELAMARATVKQRAIEGAEQLPALVARWKRAAEHADNQPLAALSACAQRPARKRRRVVAEEPADAAPAPGSALAVVASAAAAAAPAPARRALRPHTSAEEFLFGEPSSASSSAFPAADVAALETEVEAQLARFHLLPPAADLATTPLARWRTHAWQFPLLAAVAMHLFSLPASTAALERLFSAAGRAVNRRRPTLRSTAGADLIFGHANVRRGHTGASQRRPKGA